MKRLSNILLLLAVVATGMQLSSCADDDFTSTIFDTKEYPLDRNQFTFPLDTFVKVNFLEPYNMHFIYRMEYTGSDKDKNLTPASYDKSCQLAVLTKYLWHDVYKEIAEEHELFLKKYSPRIIHVVGSMNLNTSSGTETLGVTEGGTKVTLYRTNMLNPSDIADMNEYFFETMHHEFGHILDQTKLHPTPFNLLSNGLYNASSWNETPDSVAASQGFVTNYASMSYTEDWVETFARYVTDDSITWNEKLGTAEYEWETVDLKDVNRDDEVDEDDYTSLLVPGVDIDTLGYLKVDESGNGEHKIYRRVCKRDADDKVVFDENGKVQWVANSIGARQIIMQKLEFVREYMRTQYGIDIDKLRYIIQEKQFVKNADGSWKREAYFEPRKMRVRLRLVNAITNVDSETGKSKLDELLNVLEEYKKLQKN